MASDNYYELLGVSKNASDEEIKRAFRKKAHEHHPDKGGDAEKFKKINEAYQVLSDREKRSQYDTFGSSAFNGGGARPGGGFSGGGFDFGGFDFSGGSSSGFGGFGDIFSEVFGAAMSNIQAEVQISVPQAVLGDIIELRVDNERVRIEVPAGCQDGQQIAVRGKGKSYRGGRGDLIIVLRVVIPRRISRKERELYEELKKL